MRSSRLRHDRVGDRMHAIALGRARTHRPRRVHGLVAPVPSSIGNAADTATPCSSPRFRSITTSMPWWRSSGIACGSTRPRSRSSGASTRPTSGPRAARCWWSTCSASGSPARRRWASSSPCSGWSRSGGPDHLLQRRPDGLRGVPDQQARLPVHVRRRPRRGAGAGGRARRRRRAERADARRSRRRRPAPTRARPQFRRRRLASAPPAEEAVRDEPASRERRDAVTSESAGRLSIFGRPSTMHLGASGRCSWRRPRRASVRTARRASRTHSLGVPP